MTEIQLSIHLKRLGFSPALKGYHYIRQAIKLSLQDPTLLDKGVCKKLYPQIAELCDTTTARVERAIRHAIETAWDCGDIEFQSMLFGYTVDSNKGTPTNLELIATLVDYINMLEVDSK